MGRVVVAFRGGLEEGVFAGLAGLERAGEVSGSYEQKCEENEEENDFPRCRRRGKRRRCAAHGR